MRLPRLFLALLLAVSAGPATADPGHLAGLSGPDHWVAGAAIGLAIALGLWRALKGGPSAAEPATSDDGDPDEAAA